MVLSWSWRPARGVKKRIDRVYEKAVTMVEGGLKAGEGQEVLKPWNLVREFGFIVFNDRMP